LPTALLGSLLVDCWSVLLACLGPFLGDWPGRASVTSGPRCARDSVPASRS